jgi:hypothetical protein
LVEAALCLLELSYHRTGNLGLLSGMPHLMLQRMPPSKSLWRANAILIDADALAAQGRHAEAQAMLQQVITDFGPRRGIPRTACSRGRTRRKASELGCDAGQDVAPRGHRRTY